MMNHISKLFTPLGNLYIADSSNHAIRYVDDNTGTITTIAGVGGPGAGGYSGDGEATSVLLNQPYGVVVDSSGIHYTIRLALKSLIYFLGIIYIADGDNNRIRMLVNNMLTTVVGTGDGSYSGDNGDASSATINQPWGIAVDSLGMSFLGTISDYLNIFFFRR